MKNRRKRNLMIALLMIVTLFTSCFVTSFAETVSQEEYDEAQEAAKEAKEATEAKRKEAKEAAKAAAEAVANLEEAEKELQALEGQIEYTKAEIENTKADMEKKEAEIEEQNTALNKRLTAMYKTGNTGFVDVILNSESVTDLLSNVGMVHKILESDQDLLRKLQKDYEELKKLKETLEDQQIALEAQELETEELKKKYQAEADKMHELEKQLEAEAEQLAAEALAKQLEAEAMIVEAGGRLDFAPGEYAWPTQSNWQITSKYGWRICPFHGKEFHNGLDVVLTSGTKGSPVYAIADGYVTRASWYGGYGKCVTYACGNGLTVLCGHLSGYNCKAGQYVTKGSIIGYIGSTGNSTGPHLHFTVFQNGQHINPFSLY